DGAGPRRLDRAAHPLARAGAADLRLAAVAGGAVLRHRRERAGGDRLGARLRRQPVGGAGAAAGAPGRLPAGFLGDGRRHGAGGEHGRGSGRPDVADHGRRRPLRHADDVPGIAGDGPSPAAGAATPAAGPDRGEPGAAGAHRGGGGPAGRPAAAGCGNGDGRRARRSHRPSGSFAAGPAFPHRAPGWVGADRGATGGRGGTARGAAGAARRPGDHGAGVARAADAGGERGARHPGEGALRPAARGRIPM
ncbi:MAG: hypothetical protein AVDCRST_MAG27-1196, partial [uncultured Craurococcus sp.]